MIIKEVEETELAEILSLQYLAYQSEAKLTHNPKIPPLTQTLAEVQEEYRNGTILKAVDDTNHIIGSVRFYHKEGTIYIGKLFVHPEYQHQGIGSSLLLQVETLCPCKRYELFTSTLSQGNIRLYEHLGYHVYKEQKISDSLTLVYLEKGIYFRNEIDVDVYNALRDLVGWIAIPREEALSGIEHATFTISCMNGEETIGIGRLLWDHGYIAYLSDIIVRPEYQGKGIGKQIVQQLMNKLKAEVSPGWKVKICLLAAHGKEPFYKKLGFLARPNDISGAGMDLWI